LDKEVEGKASLKSGALFLFNCDDDDKDGEPDWADNSVNSEADRDDLTPIHVTIARPQIVEDITVEVVGDGAPHVRLFHQVDNKLMEHTSGQSIAVGGEKEHHFFLEGKSFATGEWDGVVEISVVADREEKNRVSTTLRVAPWIMSSSLDRGKEIYAREFEERNEAFIESLTKIVPTTGAELFVIPAGEPYDNWNIWLQDTMEVGYTQTADRYMNVVLKANRNKSLDNFPKQGLMGPDYGWFESGEYREKYGAGSGGVSWLDWYGNLEVSPAVPGYPHGRFFYGSLADGATLNPEVVDMINAQEIQGPGVPVPVDFLLIKHVDEIVGWIPTGDPAAPHKVLLPSVNELLAMMKDLQAKGHGGIVMLDIFEENLTIDKFLANQSRIDHNMSIQTDHLDPLVELVKKEFGVEDKDIIFVPSYYKEDGRAMIPSMINSLVLNGHFLAPDPNGPVIDGVDVFKADLENRFEGIPLEIHYIDDRQYHKWCGNVHCGTNARRAPRETAWWK